MKTKMGSIAVVGMSGIFPKAPDIETFIGNIESRRSSIINVPYHRWKVPIKNFLSNDRRPDTAISDKAGIIEDFNFNPEGFCVDKNLLSALDPVHHLVLTAGRDAFLQCNHSKETKKQTGVILAAIALPTDASNKISKQILFNHKACPTQPHDFLRSGMVSLPASILASAMGFENGSFTLDAACASSLYAIKLACEHLLLQKSDIMVAGGVSRPDCLYTQIGFTQLSALSPTGVCSPFDKKANGLVVGEGCGIVILKRLDDAVAAKDHIHAVIKGWGVSNDIDGTLVGPASEGQTRAMIQAYQQAAWSPDDIQYMECHGSGTPVGDQIELSSIMATLNQFDCPDTPLSIGSVKSMTGHLLTAAGAAGFIKTVLSMNKGFIPPSLNYSSPPSNSILNFSNIKVQTAPEEWKPHPTQETRKAGISAFGFGGINAHILVEEFNQKKHRHFVNTPDQPDFKAVPCAIIGMDIITKDCDTLSAFNALTFGEDHVQSSPPGSRFRVNPTTELNLTPGYYLDFIDTSVGEFHIPPNQMQDILPQHILLLKTVKKALENAGIPRRPNPGDPGRENIGCVIGIEFDYGATDFRLRWDAHGLDESVRDQISGPLTFNRTLGALGGIVASRVAREFKLGGPCFTLSGASASGIKAIETAIHSLSAYETDTFICGCVDLAGDLRQFTLNAARNPTTINPANKICLPAEGAASLVLKRLDTAQRDGDTIYGVITGVSGISGNDISGDAFDDPDRSQNRYSTSLENALLTSKTLFSDIRLFETALSNNIEKTRTQLNGLKTRFKNSHSNAGCHITSAMSAVGNTGCVSALVSTIKTALCLYHQKLPANDRLLQDLTIKSDDYFLRTKKTDPWEKRPHEITRKACVATTTVDGCVAHIILEEGNTHENSSAKKGHLMLNEAIHSPNGEQTIHLKTNPWVIEPRTISTIQSHLLDGPTDEVATMVDPESKAVPEVDQKFDQSVDIGIDPLTNSVIDPALVTKGTRATANAHEKFLEFSNQTMQLYEEQFKTLTQLAGTIACDPKLHSNQELPSDTISHSTDDDDPLSGQIQKDRISNAVQPFLNREQCLEYAIGKAGNVLGEKFDIIDTYPVRVRLPAAPLMLVDRIMSIEGEMLSLGPGKIITQHDVKHNSWYLDGEKAPVSISIEAGQADLFLCAWLGIDHAIKGSRKYRLLDARVTFHRSLPSPGETIEYHIEIDRFLKQGEVYLFFFHYKGYIDGQLLISMRDGCAGFFTEEEVENSGGIILKDSDSKRDSKQNTKNETTKKKSADSFTPLVPVKMESFSDDKIQALRQGDLFSTFGPVFKNVELGIRLRLPDGRMHLIDRVLEFNPDGGRFGLGSIIAQADIHPDDWFLTCHFIDDKVMPGTLMYECCAHTLRVFTQRMGWISDRNDVYYDVLPGNESDLKCRGPVTPATKKARYEIEIKEIGYGPEPYVIADAHMFSDELRIVLYKNMGMKLVGLTKDDLISFWRN